MLPFLTNTCLSLFCPPPLHLQTCCFFWILPLGQPGPWSCWLPICKLWARGSCFGKGRLSGASLPVLHADCTCQGSLSCVGLQEIPVQVSVVTARRARSQPERGAEGGSRSGVFPQILQLSVYGSWAVSILVLTMLYMFNISKRERTHLIPPPRIPVILWLIPHVTNFCPFDKEKAILSLDIYNQNSFDIRKEMV